MGNPLDALYTAVGWVFTHIYDLWKPLFGATSGWTWALSIVMLVVLMRLIMVPLFIKQMHTTRAMSALQPQMMALRKKYGNDKQTLNQEMMKLYQEAGVNPLMGCLPLVLQLPLFFSLFEVLKAIAAYKGGTPAYGMPKAMVVAAHSANILGAHIWDKVLFTGTLHVPLHAKIVIFIAVLISMATTYLTIKQSMKRGMMPAATPDNPMANSQKYMMYIMPLFALTGLYWEFGLVLYWVTTNVWTLGQQGLLARRYPYTPPAPSGTTTDTRGAATGAAAAKATGKVGASTAKPLVSGSSSRGGAAAAKGGSTASRTGNTASRSAASARGPAAKQQASQARPNGSRAAKASANGSGDNKPAVAPGGMLARLGRGRSTAPEPEVQEPDVKLVRHQTARQSRSKRSGKR